MQLYLEGELSKNKNPENSKPKNMIKEMSPHGENMIEAISASWCVQSPSDMRSVWDDSPRLLVTKWALPK